MTRTTIASHRIALATLLVALGGCDREQKPTAASGDVRVTPTGVKVSNDANEVQVDREGVKVGDGIEVAKNKVKVGDLEVSPDGVKIPQNAEVETAGEFDCVGGSCTKRCPDGATCKGTCSGGSCDYTCGENGRCDFTCAGGSCTQRCATGASCEMSCSGGSCKQLCDSDAKSCDKSCSGQSCSDS